MRRNGSASSARSGRSRTRSLASTGCRSKAMPGRYRAFSPPSGPQVVGAERGAQGLVVENSPDRGNGRGDEAVGPDEVGGRSATGPCRWGTRAVPRSSPAGPRACGGRAVGVQLPREGAQGRAVPLRRERASSDGAVVRPGGQGPRGDVVVDPVLADVPGDTTTDGRSHAPRGERRGHGGEPPSHQGGHGVPPGHEAERPVGDADQAQGDGPPFPFVPVEGVRAGVAEDDVGEEVREVLGVLQTGVHPLTADRGVDVGRVTGEEHRAPTEPLGDAVVDAVRGEPVDGRVADAEVPARRGESLLLSDVGTGGDGDGPDVPARTEGVEHAETPASRPHREAVLRQAGRAAHVGDPEHGVVGDALEGQPSERRTTDPAPSAPMHQRARRRVIPSGPSRSAWTRPSGSAVRRRGPRGVVPADSRPVRAERADEESSVRLCSRTCSPGNGVEPC